jgi:aryl-alcohol dehydrogenase-like predicted oxidoreductase
MGRDMELRRVGDSGLTVSAVGLGCNNFGSRMDEAAVVDVVGAALDSGIVLFDTADTYGSTPGESEELLGRALGGRRDDVIVATKFGHSMKGRNGPDFDARGSRRYIVTAVEASLRRLRTDRIDLLQMHSPDELTPIEETLAALDDMVRAGKVRYIGTSNFAGWQVADADWTATTNGWSRFVCAQNGYSLLNRAADAELVPALERFGIGLLPYFPLEHGLLTGKYHQGQAPPADSRLARHTHARVLARADWRRIEAVRKFATARDCSMVEIAVGWLLAQPVVASVIAGATTAVQVRANVAAARWVPTADELAELDGITRALPA